MFVGIDGVVGSLDRSFQWKVGPSGKEATSFSTGLPFEVAIPGFACVVFYCPLHLEAIMKVMEPRGPCAGLIVPLTCRRCTWCSCDPPFFLCLKCEHTA